MYANSSDANYEDTSNPAVKAFRDAMAKYFPDRQGKLSEWEIDGWASAQWLTDAVASCGADVTRVCVEKFMNSGKPYDAHGIITPAAFEVKAPDRDDARVLQRRAVAGLRERRAGRVGDAGA